MASIKKVPLQTYLEKQEREDFIKICEKLGHSSSSKLRVFIKGVISKNKDLL